MQDLAPDPREYVLAEQKVAEKKRVEEARKIVWTVYVDGKGYDFRLSELTPADFEAVRKGPAISINTILAGAEDRVFECFAALLWLARRQSGETDLDWEDVQHGLRYDSEMMLYVGGKEDQPGELPDPPP